MIINGKQVRGIFIYTPDAEFERGDFVISGDSIYNCTANNPTDLSNNTVSGVDPAEDLNDNFTTYLGKRIVSEEEYYTYIKNKSGEDNYVSSQILSKILQNTLFGVSDNGIIEEHIITSSEDGSTTFSAKLKDALQGIGDYSSVFDQIINAPSINHGFVRISRSLAEGLVYNDPNTNAIPDNVPEIDKISVVLKQYTYEEADLNYNNRIRIQELIDHVNGIVFYRYGVGEKDYKGNWNFNRTSAWKRSNFTSNIYYNQVNAVYKRLQEKRAELEQEKSQFEHNFRFVKLPATIISQGGREINLSRKSITWLPNFKTDDYGSFIVHCTVLYPIPETNVYQSFNLTINIADAKSTGSINYFIAEGITVYSSIGSDGSAKLSLSSGKGAYFSSIYCNQDYSQYKKS